MANSPNLSGVVKFSVYADGKAVSEKTRVVSVDVTKRVNRLPTATLVLADGDVAEGDFAMSSSDLLNPGTEIRVAAGYDQSEETIFDGVIVRHGIRITSSPECGQVGGGSRLTLECRDKAVKMTIGRRSANYVDLKDSEVIDRLVGAAGLASDVAQTSPSHPELVQYYCTDWDFMVTRAEANGLLVIVDAGKVSVKPPDVTTPPALGVTYGVDLMEFEAEIDARTQLKAVSGVAWDPRAQAIIEEEAPPATLNAQGDLKAATLAGIVGPDSYRLQSAAPLGSASLKAWAAAQQVKSGLARITGRMLFQGSAEAAIGTLMELTGVGKHFVGKVFVSALRHRIADGGWTTEVEFGMSPDWFAEMPDIVAPPASGWTAGIEGLQIGVVQKLDANPQGEPMVQVAVPVLKAAEPGVWARLARFSASDGAGAFFVPEVGDEVVLGFLANDPSHPVVLGSLYSSKRKPPYPLTAENFTKGIVTRAQLKVEFDDDKKMVTIQTPAGNQIVLNDTDQSITLTDQNGNQVELGSAGIRLDSPRDLTIQAKGKISIDAAGTIDLTSKADATVSGQNVSVSGRVGVTAKGGGSAELSSGGQTVVKGSMVMIN